MRYTIQTCKKKMVEMHGIEPWTTHMQSEHSTN